MEADQRKIRSLKGIGEKTEALFKKIHITTKEELIRYYPRTYEQFRPPVFTNQVVEGEVCAVEGMVVKTPKRNLVHNIQIISTVIKDSEGFLPLTWFNMPFLQNTLRQGVHYIFRGKVVKKAGKLEMEQPKIYGLSEYDALQSQLNPIYGCTSGLTNNQIKKAIRMALDEHPVFMEHLPEPIREQYSLAEYNFAMENIHFPKDFENLSIARKRLVFEELFFFITALRRIREEQKGFENHYVIKPSQIGKYLKDSLPYRFTKAQERALFDIQKDMEGDRTMNRLIQGDVGSGKTIVALIALLDVAEAGYQGVMMAPTEVLARQHYEGIVELFEHYHIQKKVILLTGSMTAKKKRETREAIADGRADLVIGTHALIEDKVEFSNLALVITDEQHRFGVNQREKLSLKGGDKEPVHILVMSATPIPRTLGLIVYGDLDISVMDELPKNRLPIKNCVVNTSFRKNAYRFISEEVKKGHQAYIICPMVEESEKMDAENVIAYTELLKEHLPSDIRTEYLHGKMKPQKKNEIMNAFLKNEIQVLVSTTVIEVGVNVPNATVMMVENAERFGLAQLHQLRGRVGRGKDQSYCIFINTSERQDTVKRLEILKESNDGFYIAEEDLKLRGPGDLFGIQQSGEMPFQIADIYQDAPILLDAAKAAGILFCEDPHLMLPENQKFGRYLDQYISENLRNLNL